MNGKSEVVWRRQNARKYVSHIGEIRWRDGWAFHPANSKGEPPMWFPTLEMAKREAEKGLGADAK